MTLLYNKKRLNISISGGHFRAIGLLTITWNFIDTYVICKKNVMNVYVRKFLLPCQHSSTEHNSRYYMANLEYLRIANKWIHVFRLDMVLSSVAGIVFLSYLYLLIIIYNDQIIILEYYCCTLQLILSYSFSLSHSF